MEQLTFKNLEINHPEFPVAVLFNDRINQSERISVCHSHWHEQLELHYITDGELEFFIDQKPYILKKGDVALVGKNLLHYSFYTGRLQELILIFDLKNFSTELAEKDLCYHSAVRGDPTVQKLLNQLQEEYSEQLAGYQQACKGLLLQLMAYLSRSYVHATAKEERKYRVRQLERLTPARRYIETHYAEPLDTQVLAELLHISPDRFNHLFKEAMGISPGKYINEVRLHRAMILLRIGKHSFSEVAQMCGFTDYNHFGRLFRKTFGCTPSQITLYDYPETAK